jgi:hypothetical protein
MIIIEVRWGDGKWRPVENRGIYADDQAYRAHKQIARFRSSYEYHYQSPAPEYRLVYARRVAVVKELKGVT